MSEKRLFGRVIPSGDVPPEENAQGRVPVEERRRQLARAGFSIVVDEGIAAVTTRNVCARAGAHLSVFHYCFTSKAELIDAMVELVLDVMVDGMAQIEINDVSEFVHALWAIQAKEWRLTFGYYELMVFAARERNFAEASDAPAKPYLERYAAILEELAAREGKRWFIDPLEVARIVMSMSTGVGMTQILGVGPIPGEGPPPEHFEAFVGMLEGLMVPA